MKNKIGQNRLGAISANESITDFDKALNSFSESLEKLEAEMLLSHSLQVNELLTIENKI